MATVNQQWKEPQLGAAGLCATHAEHTADKHHMGAGGGGLTELTDLVVARDFKHAADFAQVREAVNVLQGAVELQHEKARHPDAKQPNHLSDVDKQECKSETLRDKQPVS